MILLVVLVAHFGLILATVLPEEVVPDPVRAAGERYVDPVFKQEWSLFAPDPLDGDVQILVRAKPAGSGDWTGWTDVYGPVLRDARSRPFSPLAGVRITLLRSALSPLKMMFFDRDSLEERRELFRSWQEPGQKPAELIALERAASQELQTRYPGTDLELVQVRLVLTLLPPAARDGGREVPLRLTLPEAEFDAGVAPRTGH